jgi:3',5'-cyclic-AMP phosphodiesterase
MAASALTRRELLGAGGAGALALALPAPLFARRRAALPVGGGFRPELVGVSQRGFEAWWPTEAPADTTVRFARADGRGGVREQVLARGRVVHAARVSGLDPGTAYRYELRSGGHTIATSLENPGGFTTLPRLEGRRLARIAVLNDLHVGEQCSGTITDLGFGSLPPCFSADDYAYRMCDAALREIKGLRPDLVIANGDLTDRGRPGEVDRALSLLRRSRRPLLITRGNHDRRYHEAGPACDTDGDCLREKAFPTHEVGEHALTSVVTIGRRVAVVGLDSCDPESGEGRLDLGGQLEWLDGRLAALRRQGRITIVAFHHHVATQANATHPPPLLFGVRADRGGADALEVIGRHGVPLTLHGHTHRNYLVTDPRAPRTWFLENGAIKEYPAGYAILDVREDGIVRTFHRPVSDFAREWVRTSANQIWGLQPDYTRGTLRSRSFVLRFAGGGGPGAPTPSVIGPLGAET